MMVHSPIVADFRSWIKPRVRASSVKSLSFGIAFLLFSWCLPSAAGQEEIPKLRVACVGDSITEGTANADYRINSWPQILQRMLDRQFPDQYEIRNFGRSGATLLRKGRKPYWDQDVYSQALAYDPNLVILNLGTNDATEANWIPHGSAFEDDCRKLIETFRGLSSKPRVYLSNLTEMMENHPLYEECKLNRLRIERILHKLAREYELPIIDFKTPTAGRMELFPDGLHPNTAGNALLAGAAFEAICGKKAPGDPSLQPLSVEGERHHLVQNGKGIKVKLGNWKQASGWVEGTGAKQLLLSKLGVAEGDFHLQARLRMRNQKNSAAGFVINDNFFGFEGARGTVFRNGPQMGGLRLLHPAELLWKRDDWIEFEVIRNGAMVWFLVNQFIVDMAPIPGKVERLGFDPTRSLMQIKDLSIVGSTFPIQPRHWQRRSYRTPWVDLSIQKSRVKFLSKEDVIIGNTLVSEPLIDPESGERISFVSAKKEGQPAFVKFKRPNETGWSEPLLLPAILTGTGYAAAILADGRVLVTFRDLHPTSPTRGDFVAWVGRIQDLRSQEEGDFTCRLLQNRGRPLQSGSLGLKVFPDGTVVSTAESRSRGGAPIAISQIRYDLPAMIELLPTRGSELPLLDLDRDSGRHVVVDREEGQYLGHVTTVLLEDGKTMLAVYPKGHGKGAIVYKRSEDGGLTWSGRLPTPQSWQSSREVPTIHRVIDPESGQKRLILWSGLYPARLAVSEDDGVHWSELQAAGDWGGIVVMGFVERLRNGSYLAMFHDDGRFISKENRRVHPPVFTVYKTFSHDGGYHWTEPEVVWSGTEIHLCEPGCIRSPDGRTLAVLLRENSRTQNSYVIFSEDEGLTWSPPRELPASLTGDRHTGKMSPDGRLFISFRDTSHDSSTQGDWNGWVGTWEDIYYGRPGQYRVRIKDNKHRWDTAYPGVEVLPNGTFVVTTYGHWEEGKPPYILSARFTLEELDRKASEVPWKKTLFTAGMNGVHTYRIPALAVTQSGALIACVDARIRSSRDLPNNIDTVIRRSFDGGKSWGEVQTILDWPEGEGTADPCLLVDSESNRVWCAVTWSGKASWSSSKPGFGRDSFHNYLVYSDDDGQSWSKPINITREIKDPDWKSTWFSPGAGLVSKQGRMFLPFSAADENSKVFTFAAASDDGGKNWRRIGPMGANTNESMIVQLSDQRLLCNMRSRHGFHQRAISYSGDGGANWSPLEHHSELVGPVCQASLLTVPAAITPDQREWLVFCNPASKKRDSLSLRVSFDGGLTWPVLRQVHSGPAAYSCMSILADGRIGLLYERGEENPYEGIGFASIPLTWLAE
ncbi:MAG: hypothetical protein DWQ01_04875 [Planctomycetota bacterium]|nr:MAG: hypothetical protein DWQ01_04875 [Planctomycetota bacterium]